MTSLTLSGLIHAPPGTVPGNSFQKESSTKFHVSTLSANLALLCIPVQPQVRLSAGSKPQPDDEPPNALELYHSHRLAGRLTVL